MKKGEIIKNGHLKLTNLQAENVAKNINEKLGEVVIKTDALIQRLQPDYQKYYSDIENAIMEWSRDGKKTAGTLTRKIIKILNTPK
jgi:hypothetical protein